MGASPAPKNPWQTARQRAYRRLARAHADDFDALYREELEVIGAQRVGGKTGMVSRQCQLPSCRVWYQPRMGGQKYCSSKCAKRASALARAAPSRKKICDHCGKAFTTKYAKARWCSPSCRKSGNRAENVARRLKNYYDAKGRS